MHDSRSVWGTRFGLTALAALGLGGCLVSGQDGDPGASFLAGTAGAPAATGAAGRPPTGAAGSGAAGAGGKPIACPLGATATFELAWTLEDAMGKATTCDAVGGQTVDVTVVSLVTGAEASSTVTCGAAMATSCPMPAGDYRVSLTLKGAGGAVLSEIAAPTLFLLNGQVTRPATLPFALGGDATMSRGFALTWAIEDEDTGASVTCAAAGAKTVRLVAGDKTFDLPCTAGMGRTAALPPGDLAVTLSLLDAQSKALSVTNTMTVRVGAGQLVFLGDVVFGII